MGVYPAMIQGAKVVVEENIQQVIFGNDERFKITKI